jgi:predicted RNA-binding Zn ribbon-like protein
MVINDKRGNRSKTSQQSRVASREIAWKQEAKGIYAGVPHVTAEDFKTAASKLSGATRGLEWAVELAQAEIGSLTPGERLNARISLRAFVDRLGSHTRIPENTKYMGPSTYIPTEKCLERSKELFGKILNGFLPTGSIETIKVSLAFSIQSYRPLRNSLKVIQISPSMGEQDLPSRAVFRFAELLAPELERLRQCEDKDCARWYIGRPNRKFCSNKCLSRATTRKFMEKKSK